MELLLKLKHRNIVQLYGLWRRKDAQSGTTRLYMVMELCKGGSLRSRICQGSISVADKLRWARDVADGICFLHSRDPPVLHRDIKPANVVLTHSGGQAKLVDFGLSKYASASAGPATALVGTVAYMAPELMSNEPGGHDQAVDMYSFAVLLCALWTEEEPYKGMFTKQILVNVTLHNKRPSLDLKAGADQASPLHSSMCALIEDLWQTDPEARPTAPQASRRLHTIKEGHGPD